MPARYFAVLLSCLGAVSTFAEAGPPVVTMPEVVVAEHTDEQIEQWRYVRTANFEILSQAKDGAIRQFLERLELMPLVAQTIWPAPRPRKAAPVSILVCGSDHLFKTFVPAVVKASVNEDWVDRLFMKDGQQKVIVLDGDRVGDQGRIKDIFREYARSCLVSFQQPPPDWFVTGMAEVIVDAEYSVVKGRVKIQYAGLDKVPVSGPTLGIDPSLYDTERPSPEVGEIIRGALDDRSSYKTMVDDVVDTGDASERVRFNRYFGKYHFHPALEDVLLKRAGPNPDEYRMTCWALVHMCAFADRGNKEHLRVVLETLAKNPSANVVETFRRAFGCSMQTLDATLAHYAESAISPGVTKQVDFPGSSPVEVTMATAEQIGRLKSAAYRAGGHDDEAQLELAKARRLAAPR